MSTQPRPVTRRRDRECPQIAASSSLAVAAQSLKACTAAVVSSSMVCAVASRIGPKRFAYSNDEYGNDTVCHTSSATTAPRVAPYFAQASTEIEYPAAGGQRNGICCRATRSTDSRFASSKPMTRLANRASASSTCFVSRSRELTTDVQPAMSSPEIQRRLATPRGAAARTKIHLVPSSPQPRS